jgi:hypothetical protein
MDDFDVLYSAKNNRLAHVLLGYDTVLEHRFFRPVPMFSFWLQTKLFGVRPAMFHLTTLLLHAFNGILAANLFYILFRDYRSAALFGFLFIVFPNHEEVIHSPAINFTSWAAFFYLATLNLFGYYRLSSRSVPFVASLFSFSAAILSKELAFTLPVSLLVFDYFFSRLRGIKLTVRRRAANHGTYVVLLVLALFSIRRWLRTGYGYLTPEGEDFISLYLDDAYLLLRDFTKMNFDVWKNLIVPVSGEIAFQKGLVILIPLSLAIACAVLVLKRRIHTGALVYCAVFVTVTSLPVLAVYNVLGLTHGTRLLYLPSTASCYVISMILGGILSGMRRPAARYAFLILVMLPIVALTKFYDNKWIRVHDDNEKFIDEVLRKTSRFPEFARFYVSNVSPYVHYGLPNAIGLYREKRSVEAALDFLPPIKILSLEREDYSERHWHYFWLTWDGKTGTLDMAQPIQPETSDAIPRYTWDFAEGKNQGALEPAKDISRVLVPNAPYPVFLVGGGWALMKLPVLRNRLPIKYLTLDMMLRGGNRRENVSRIFWVTEHKLNYGGERSIGFYSLQDGEFHQYKIPLYRHGQSLIDSRILRFAIRPSQTPGTVFMIRKMTVEHY